MPVFLKGSLYVCCTINTQCYYEKCKPIYLLCNFICNVISTTFVGDNIPTEGIWDDEYYRSVNTNRPPVASIEGDILP